jgi:hypothetical protein
MSVARGRSLSSPKPTSYSNSQSTESPTGGKSPTGSNSQQRSRLPHTAGPSTPSASVWLDPADRWCLWRRPSGSSVVSRSQPFGSGPLASARRMVARPRDGQSRQRPSGGDAIAAQRGTSGRRHDTRPQASLASNRPRRAQPSRHSAQAIRSVSGPLEHVRRSRGPAAESGAASTRRRQHGGAAVVRANRAPVNTGLERSEAASGGLRVAVTSGGKCLHMRRIRLCMWDAPGTNRTCARGLGNRCSIH